MHLLFRFVLLLNLVATPAAAIEKCPVDDAQAEKAGGYAAAVEAALKATPDCTRAFRTLEACQLGSSADNALGDMVGTVCEARFLPAAKPATRRAYERAKRRCDRIAEKNDGTLYQSMAALCRAGAARDFAKKYGAAQ